MIELFNEIDTSGGKSMSQQIPLPNHQRSSALQVWTRLAVEQRAQVIRLMAQLAFKLVLAQPNSPLKEVDHGVVGNRAQNSS